MTHLKKLTLSLIPEDAPCHAAALYHGYRGRSGTQPAQPEQQVRNTKKRKVSAVFHSQQFYSAAIAVTAFRAL